jgi:BirA family transcriptional regulator, biotin operon repressor / biotin---[acetyl-CoA-carboxylase] ligase
MRLRQVVQELQIGGTSLMPGDPALASAPIVAFDSLGSTNAEALARARGGERGPLWISARLQTSGRGRRGRAWVSQPGNLHATLLMIDAGPAVCAPELSFVAGLAACDAITEGAPALAQSIKLKWPNDVLLHDAKLAGILIEGEGTPQGHAVAIGFGVNCAHHPADTEFPAADLAAAGVKIAPEALLAALAAAMATRMAQWQRGAGFPSIRSDWLARAAGIGNPLRVRLEGGNLDGRFEALDERGRLLLRMPDGTVEVIAAGDVFPLTGAPTAVAAGR